MDLGDKFRKLRGTEDSPQKNLHIEEKIKQPAFKRAKSAICSTQGVAAEV